VNVHAFYMDVYAFRIDVDSFYMNVHAFRNAK
jgi:hypothetical protein